MKKNVSLLLLTGLLYANIASAAVAPECEAYFKETDKYLDKLKELNTDKAQLDVIRQQYDLSKKQMSTLPSESQKVACSQALQAMKQSMEAAGMK
ncbi:DUF5339 domain-containing protein [Salmonella enterica]|nr:hypothetical protein [Salmonella enterica subsp. enterica serovar Panama]EHS0390590.1 DUF5339 domain-containing protein [Salmonella enterica]EII9336848.1 DUF5339 domain-containing protein [Salmonella enterica]EJI0186999.1 DUF5339 domain-containing protein [Salmonella enterica]HCM4742667.1 DUF5339 domain-containing protein [Salmonella enterica subsp. enterica serovar Panama]